MGRDVGGGVQRWEGDRSWSELGWFSLRPLGDLTPYHFALGRSGTTRGRIWDPPHTHQRKEVVSIRAGGCALES